MELSAASHSGINQNQTQLASAGMPSDHALGPKNEVYVASITKTLTIMNLYSNKLFLNPIISTVRMHIHVKMFNMGTSHKT